MSSVQFSCSVLSDSVTPWTAAWQASLSITNSQSLLRLMSIESVMPSNNVVPFSRLQSFLSSVSFPMSQFFPSGGQSIGISASKSVLPVNIWDWFSLRWTGWISLQSKGLSRVFLSTSVQKHQFFTTQHSLWSNRHIHTWLLKKPCFDYVHLCWPSNVSAVLSRFVRAFLPRRERLNFMAAATIGSDCGAQENKVSHCFHCFPIYLPCDGTKFCDLSFLNVEF